MPTPVSAARQCLAEEAASALDEAVAVAKRRGHAQTTSLHAVSALLSLPSSTLREACTRARTGAYSPRLQYRALELCVGVALDRVSGAKSGGSVAEEPPVSNSLMAAIKRSQANQRRHPETFHLYQQQMSANPQCSSSISTVKVEMKHFVMSILDDPIVSRVFGDAGFRTYDLKMAIVNPISMSRFSGSAAALFCGQVSGGGGGFEANKRGPKFPFPMEEGGDGNSRRVAEMFVKTSKRNPLLVGVGASDALKSFVECVKRNEAGVLPKEIDGVIVVSVEQEITEFINGRSSEERMRSKLIEVSEMAKNCQGPGVVVSCGDLRAFVEVESSDLLARVVFELKTLLIDSGGKLWVIGSLTSDDEYKRLVKRLPSIENDWDLHLLPITTSIGGKPFKSSLMGSFVPFGGFFSLPSELETVCSSSTQSSSLCSSCNEKYETEVSVIMKGESVSSIADKHSVHLSSWMQIAGCESSQRRDAQQIKDDEALSDARVKALKSKWSDICRRLHSSWTSQQDFSKAKFHNFTNPSLQNVFVCKDTTDVGSSNSGNRITNFTPCLLSSTQKYFPPKHNFPGPVMVSDCAISQAEVPLRSSDRDEPCNPLSSLQKINLPIACTSSPSFVSVATDLGLGTLYTSPHEGGKKNNSRESKGIQNSSESSKTHENTSNQASQSSSCSNQLDKQAYMKDLQYPWRVLAEKFSWQSEAIQTIARTVVNCRNWNGRHCSSNEGNMWLSFLGPDKVTKRKIAASVAEIVFGRKENFMRLDLSLQYGTGSFNSIVDCYDLSYPNLKTGRKMIVDSLAEELSRHPHSMILLENIEKADIVVQNSLSRAMKTGKFPDSRGRDYDISSIVFILSSSVFKPSEGLPFCRVASKFPEEKVLDAKNLQMQILLRHTGGNYNRNGVSNVSVTPVEVIPYQCSGNKRKLTDAESGESEVSKRSCQSSRPMIDLNLPVEEAVEDTDTDSFDEDKDFAQNSEVWLEELLEHVNANVVFKPFDFDSLTKIILKEIDVRLKRVVTSEIFLQIDQEVMFQILAAAWLTDRKDSFEDWIEKVLCLTLEEARRRSNVTSDIVMRLVSCDGLVVEEQACGVCLPARIKVT